MTTEEILGLDLSTEIQFLKSIGDKLDDNSEESKEWFWVMEKSPTIMSFSMYCSADSKFEQEDITKIIEILATAELEKFVALRNLGGCSAYDLTGCRPGYLEFNWLNLPKTRREKDSNSAFDLCSCVLCNFRFNP